MQDADFGETVVGVPRHPLFEPGLADADTVIHNRPAAPPRPAGPPRPVVATALPTTARAPARYRIRVGNQDPIILDAPVYIGRRPIPPRIPLEAPPHLVTVPSPLREVSGTHVEVIQQGSSIIVTDLKSTNATVVLVPGAIPLRLRQGESVVVTPGTVVDIGDGNRIEILPTQRLT
ncbi:MAG: FHA domain-containing protein [Terrimesophilobacter sp.]